MTPKTFRGAHRVVVALFTTAALTAFATPLRAQTATTTGTIRGAVTSRDGAVPLAGATVIVTNAENGVRRGTQTDERGRYSVPFLDPGLYTVRGQTIGYRATEKPGIRIAIGQVQTVDFALELAPIQLQTQRVTADLTPLIERQKTGTNTRIDQQQIANLPVNGRNFKDLVVLTPGVSDVGSTGSGGGQSIGGGRTGATNILMDGVNNNESFFGGDARGGDRAPFSYSIEAVKEIQVITSGTDVERGQFTGGTVNAVTKQGTNRFDGALFGYLRQDKLGSLKLTANDYLGRAPIDFKSQQYGVSLGGPIIKDHAHFFFALDKSIRTEPRPVFVGGPTDAGIRASGIHPDTLANFLGIAQRVYGYDLTREVGNFDANTNEDAFFGRVDWQISANHKVSIRDNFTKVDLTKDRLFVSPTSQDLLSNSGDNVDKSNSLVASLFSTFSHGISNELRGQYATEKKPRPSNPSGTFGVPLPQVRINNVRSTLSDGSAFATTIFFGADPVLHSNKLEETTYELIDNLRLTKGDHSFKIGTDFTRVHPYNKFRNNSLGSFTFNSMQDFEARNPASFTRALPFTGLAEIPVQDYYVNEVALYAQDEYQVTPKLFLQYGLRYDYSWYPTKPPPNRALQRSFPYLDVTVEPRDPKDISPRIGFTFDPAADGRQVFRGSSNIFYGRAPYVLWSNALLNTGQTQLGLNCSGAATPIPDFQGYAKDPGSIPSACIGAGAPSPAPSVNVFDQDFKQSYSWRTNLAYDRLLADSWRITAEGVYSTVRNNYVVQDDNLNTIPRFFIEGGLPVYVDPARVSTSSGAISRAFTRLDNSFDNVYVHRSLGSTLTWLGILQLRGNTSWGSMLMSYTYDHTWDNQSTPCCITNSMFTANRVAGNPNDFNNQWGPADFNRVHSIVFSPTVIAPFGFTVSGIVRLFSGLAWTPRYGNDVNGDGVINDRLYVPTTSEVLGYQFFGTTALEQSTQRSQFEQLIEGTDCLRNARGSTIDRNACRNPWQSVVDARLSKKFTTLSGQNVELVADFFNVLNGLNKNWGKRLEVGGNNDQLLNVRGFNPTTNRFIYQVNPNFAQITPSNNFSSTQFQMQLGLRYNF